MRVLKQYGDLISVAGALLLFFNWIATNIVAERFKGAKTAYLEANLTARLFATLHSIQSSIESVASEALNNRRDMYRFDWEAERRRNAEASPLPYVEVELLWRFSTSSLNARQIDWGVQACQLQVDQSRVDRSRTKAGAELEKVYGELNGLKDEKDVVFEQAGAYLERVRSKGTLADVDYEGLDEVLKPYSESVLPRFGPLLGRFVDAANDRVNELSEAFQLSSRNLATSRRVSVALYFLGSMLVLLGAILTKLV